MIIELLEEAEIELFEAATWYAQPGSDQVNLPVLHNRTTQGLSFSTLEPPFCGQKQHFKKFPGIPCSNRQRAHT
jgi:hypothetical protein